MGGEDEARGEAALGLTGADALEAALNRALGATFGADAALEASRRSQGFDEQQQRDADAARKLLREWRRHEERCDLRRCLVEGALGEWVRRNEARCVHRAYQQVGIVPSLQMDRRYKALRSMSSCDLLLKRVEQTIGAIEAKIASDSCERYAAVFDSAARALQQQLARVREVEVGQPCVPEGADADAGAGDAPVGGVAGAGDVDGAAAAGGAGAGAPGGLDDRLVGVFQDALGLPQVDVLGGVERESQQDLVANRIDVALAAVRACLDEWVYQAAQGVAGRRMPAFDVPAFGGVRCVRVVDVAQLTELLLQVKASYATYAKSVRQGGLFCAFGSDGEYGEAAPSAFSAFFRAVCSDPDEDEGDDDDRPEGIPDFVDEEAKRGGDDIARAIERMKTFNAQRYGGVLDDDPALPAEHFWYGVKKLSSFAEQAIQVDERAWDSYIDRVEYAVCEAAKPLSEAMDDEQLAQLEEALGALLADDNA